VETHGTPQAPSAKNLAVASAPSLKRSCCSPLPPTHDLNRLAGLCCRRRPGNLLCRYIPALDRIDSWGGGDSIAGLDGFIEAVRRSAADPEFVAAQLDLHDVLYFNRMMAAAIANGIRSAAGWGAGRVVSGQWVGSGRAGLAQPLLSLPYRAAGCRR
jgi:hypothetical protein